MTKKKSRSSKLVGFARLRITDPDRLKEISSRAGKKAQRLYGKRIRWSKQEARKMAGAGGRAVQRQYRRDGHPLQIAAVRRAEAARGVPLIEEAPASRPAPAPAPPEG